MKVLFSKHIHSSGASFSSNDAWVRFLTEDSKLDFSPEEGENINSSEFPFLNGKVSEINADDEFMIVYLEADKTFQNRFFRDPSKRIFGDGYENTQEFKDLVQNYVDAGWDDDLKNIPERDAFWKRQEQRDALKAKEAGIVLWMPYDDYTFESFQGGFSPEVINVKPLKDYIGDGKGVFGWIGNSCTRRAEHDKVIEAGLKKRGLSPKQMYNWISSSDGRHFAESLSSFNFLEEQLEEIEKNLNRIYNLCLIYGCPEHGGTYDSTEEIRERYENLGLLLPEEKAEYSAGGHFKFLASFLVADKKMRGEELSEQEEELIEEMRDNLQQQKLLEEVTNLTKK